MHLQSQCELLAKCPCFKEKVAANRSCPEVNLWMRNHKAALRLSNYPAFLTERHEKDCHIPISILIAAFNKECALAAAVVKITDVNGAIV